MTTTTLEHVLERCNQWILDEKRLVTSFWLAHALQISCRDAKQALTCFLRQHNPNHEVLKHISESASETWDYVQPRERNEEETKSSSSTQVQFAVQTLVSTSSSAGARKFELLSQDQLSQRSASKQDRVEIYAIQATNKTDVANMQLDKTAMYNADAEQVRNLTRKEGSLGDHLKYNRAGRVRLNEEVLKVGIAGNDYHLNEEPALPKSSSLVGSNVNGKHVGQSNKDKRAAGPQSNERFDNSHKSKKTLSASSFFGGAKKKQPDAKAEDKSKETKSISDKNVKSEIPEKKESTKPTKKDHHNVGDNSKVNDATEDDEDDKLFDNEDSGDEAPLPAKSETKVVKRQDKAKSKEKINSLKKRVREDNKTNQGDENVEDESTSEVNVSKTKSQAKEVPETKNSKKKQKPRPKFNADDESHQDEDESKASLYFNSFAKSSKQVDANTPRKKRKKLVDKTFEENGYLVTKKVMEEVSDDEEETIKSEPARVTPKRSDPKPSAKNLTEKKQSSMMSFFQKS